MKNKILFLEENTPELVNQLLGLGLPHSKYCNEGIYLSIVNGVIFQTYHKPYKNHEVFEKSEDLIKYCKKHKS